jgi:hypothetical protein
MSLYRIKAGKSEWLLVTNTLTSVMKFMRRKQQDLPEQEFEIFRDASFLGNSRCLPLFDPILPDLSNVAKSSAH